MNLLEPAVGVGMAAVVEDAAADAVVATEMLRRDIMNSLMEDAFNTWS